MTRLAANWLTQPETRAVTDALAGFETYFVGGCVRNTLLEMPVGDIDIATAARPEQVIEAAEAAGLKHVPTGIDHGTVTLVSGKIPFEVTTFRRDVETDGRRATVAFADDIAQDARRRDFTMNALYADPKGNVIDPLGGLPDLLARRVRFIEDPDERIREDFLRILRFFRFHAWYGDPEHGLDPDGLAACARNLDGLAGLSKERVGAEMTKLLAAPDPAPSLAAMQASGVLHAVLPGADASALPVLVHLEQGLPPDPIRRLAVLGGDDPASRFRLSRKDARALNAIREAALGSDAPATLAYRIGPDLARDAILVRHALLGAPLPDDLDAQLQRGGSARFPLKAADLPELEGPALGARLKELEQRWIESGFAASREELLQQSRPRP